MIENMKDNHAYIYKDKRNNHLNKNDLFQEYKDRFLKYRID